MGGPISGSNSTNSNEANQLEVAQRAAHERAMASLRRREAEAIQRCERATAKIKEIRKQRGEFKKT